MVQTIAFQVKLLSQCVFQSYTVSTLYGYTITKL